MPPTIPTIEPRAFISGDTVKFHKDLPDFPPADWSLTYVLQNDDADDTSLSVTATEADGRYLVTITAAQSAALPAGIYSMHGRVTDGTDVYSVFSGKIEICADVGNATGTFDNRTFAAKQLEAIETSLAASLTAEFVTFSVDGQSFTRMPRVEAMDIRDRLKAEVESEKQADRIKQGMGSGRTVFTRFG